MEYQAYDKFEYKVLIMSNYQRDIENKLNNLGEEGWELIQYANINDMNCQLILKRKLMCIKTDMINE